MHRMNKVIRIKRRHHSAGFTMMELLIAATLVALLGAMLYQSIGRSIDSKEQIEKISDRYDEVRIAMNRMADEISMAYLSAHYNHEERRTKTLFREDSESEGDRLIFTSFPHMRRVRDAKESDQNVLTYWVDSDPGGSGQSVLLRRERARIDETTGEDISNDDQSFTDVLCTGVRDLTFDYWDENEKEWTEEWDSDSLETSNKLPPRVRIRMSIDDQNGREITFETQAEIMLRLPIKLSS